MGLTSIISLWHAYSRPLLFQARSAAPPSAVYLLGADDFAEEDIPEGAFVVYQVRKP